VVTLTVWCATAAMTGEHPTKIQERLADGCETIFKMATGALIGLVGGRAGAPDKIELSDSRANAAGTGAGKS
jgi:hypothetical protein